MEHSLNMLREYFYHERNLQGKIDKDYKGKSDIFKTFKISDYDPYKKNQLSINGVDKKSIFKKVSLLNDYYCQIDRFLNINNYITTQSKVRSTILEEFCGFLFKDLPTVAILDFNFFNKKVYAGVAIDRNGKVFPKTKDVDFCIGKKVDTDFGGQKYKIIVPLIAIECKTWLDKTMFSEAQFTSQKLKQGTPNVKVYVLAGYSGISKNEIPSKGQTPIDQVYLIGDTRIKVDDRTIYDFFKDISKDLIEITKLVKINKLGKLIPD
jgi:hypothetical protein